MNTKTSRLAGWPLPRIGLGTGTWYFREPDRQARVTELVHHVLASPNPYIDTAALYGSGTSEAWLGQALRGVPRDSYLIASKVGWAIQPDGSPALTDLTRDGLLRSLEGSLKRLGLDHIDVCHLHDPDGHLRESLDVAFPTLIELREKGVIRAVGCGMNQWEMLVNFAREVDVDCFLLAGRYTLLEQKGLSLLNLCQDKGIPVFPAGVYNSGILVTGPVPGARFQYAEAPPEIVERVRRLAAVCERHGVTMQAATLQLAAAHPAVPMLIVGANSIDEWESTQQAYRTPIPPALWDDLRGEGLLEAGVPVPG
jgi:D-threo-aldose 1-dehydrogenase